MIALFVVAALLAIATTWLVHETLFVGQTIGWFIAIAISIATVIAAVITNLSDDQSKAQKYAEALVTANAAKTTQKPGSTVKPGDLCYYGVDTNYKASTVFKGHLWKQSLGARFTSRRASPSGSS